MGKLLKNVLALSFFTLTSILFSSSVLALDSEIKLIKDINDIEKGSNPNKFIEVNGKLFFRANDNLHGEEWWISDGTAANTILLKDIYPGPTSSTVSSPSTTEVVVLNNQIFFLANDGTHGAELWKSDGTTSGTVMVKDIREGSIGSNITDLEVSNGLIFFDAYISSTGKELWKSDGTEAGTVMVKDIYVGSESSSPKNLTNVGGTLFFQANSVSSTNYELWKSNGTEAGTSIVKSHAEFGGGVSSFQDFYNYDDLLVFVVVKNIGKYLWVSDGTNIGTVQIKSLSNDPDDFIILNGILYFNIGDNTYGTELWKTDGTAIGTTIVKDISPGAISSNPRNFVLLNNKIYFNTLTQLWESDGTESGTILIKTIPQIGDSNLWYDQTISFKDNLYFTAYDSLNGYELWKSDGTSDGTTLFKDIYTGSGNSAEPYFYFVFNNNLYFSAYTSSKGRELYKSDGTVNGTVLFKNINTTTESADPSTLIKLDEIALFAATSSQGRELWKTDKTEAGTVMVKDIYPGSGSSNPTNLTKLGNNVFFIANNGTNGNELWKSDGSYAKTEMIKDIYPGSSSSNITGLVSASNLLYFFADNGTTGKELWKSDGTASGTILVKDITIGSSSSTLLNSILYPIDDKVYFSVYKPETGYELWVSDGSEIGTKMIKDIYPGNQSSFPQNFMKLNDAVIFSANDGINGQELWRTDGTEAGTYLLLDIIPGSDWLGPLSSYPSNFFLYNDIILMQAAGELWKTNGTVEGTTNVKNLYTGIEGVSNPKNFKLFGGKVYFSATPVGSNQDELYVTDGTTAGTRMVKDIYPGSTGSGAGNFIVVNDRLYFTATHPSYGKELWTTDGSETGTYMAFDVYEGAISSDPRIIKFNDDIIVTGTLTEYGRELFWIQMPPNPPWGLSAVALSPTSIQLNWTDIAKSEDRFNIYYSTDGVNYSKYGSVDKDVTTINVTGLQPNTLYWFKASGENNKGQNYTDPITRATRSSYSDFVLTSSPIEDSNLCQVKATWLGNSTAYNLSYGDTVLSDIVGNEYIISDLDCDKKFDISLTGRNVEGVFESPITLRIKTSKSNIVIVDEETTPPIQENSDYQNKNSSDVEGARLFDNVVEIAKAITTTEFADSAQEVALATGAAATLLQPAVGGVSMFTNSLSLSNVFVLLGQFFNKILIFLGFRKQGRNFGYVYNSVTKAPISLAVIRFFNLEGELVTTAVTNSFGVFETDIEKGKYKLVISKNGFEFPSKLIIGDSDGEIQNIYDGGYIDLEKNDISNLSIPLDPIEANNLFFAKRILLQIVKYLSFALFLIGFLYSCYVLYVNVSLYNFLVLAVYVFIIYQYIFGWLDANRNGIVKKGGKAMKGVKVGLMLTTLDKIVDVRITDSEGKYKFVATPGEYQIVLNDSRYTEISTNDKVFTISGKKPEVIYRNIEID